MRRAFQRCVAALPQLFAVVHSHNIATPRPLQVLRLSSTRFAIPQYGVRTFHQIVRRQQEAVAQATQDANGATEELTKFSELEERGLVHPNIVRTLTQHMKIDRMTEVQSQTLTEAVKGTDMIAQAKTGTGKTLAFLIPILQRILNTDPSLALPQRYPGRGYNDYRNMSRASPSDIRAIIISPTRELAEQIAVEAKKVTQNTGLIVQTAVGGTQKSAGLRAIQREGCHILVATPGRLKDILTDPYSRVEAPNLSALVLDEADRLMDQGFWPEIQEIQRCLPTPEENDRQTLMFSATVPREVINMVRQTLKPGFQFVQCVRDDEEPTHERVPQKVVRVGGFENQMPALVELCMRGIEAAKEPGARPFKAIVYFGSTAEVSLARSILDNLEPLSDSGEEQDNQPQRRYGRTYRPNALMPARIYDIHSKLTQAQRTSSSNSFRDAKSAILISSDVTARGLDFPDVTHVIQVGLPSSREQYIHRIGRTGRAGKEGEGWIIINALEANEARQRLVDLPLQRDTTLEVPALDLTQAADVPVYASHVLAMYQRAVKKVDIVEKAKAFMALFGVYQWCPSKQRLVDAMNNLAKFGWGMQQAPPISPGLVAKLGLHRTEGLNIGHLPELDAPQNARRGGSGGSYGGRGGQFGGGRYDAFSARDGGRGRFGDRGGSGGRGGYGGRNGGRSGGDRGGMGFGRSRNSDPFA